MNKTNDILDAGGCLEAVSWDRGVALAPKLALKQNAGPSRPKSHNGYISKALRAVVFIHWEQEMRYKRLCIVA